MLACRVSALKMKQNQPFWADSNSIAAKVRAVRHYSRLAAAGMQTAAALRIEENEENCNVNLDWDNLGFGLTPIDYMYTMRCSKGESSFSPGTLTRYGNIELSPCSGVLNYGQGIFEGLKAFRREDNSILLFRPEQNALRMQFSAERLCMPAPTVEQFVNAVKQMVIANKRWVPPWGKGSLYIRPLLMGSGPVLGVAPAPEYTFLAYASPVGNYYKDPLDLAVEDKIFRAIPGRGGTGGVKAISNYSPTFKATRRAKANGLSDCLYLDAATGKNIEESSASNIFVVKENVISTPSTDGSILPGITRDSIIQIASGFGYQIEERPVSVEELMDADEAFCTGTAMVVKSVGSVTYQGKRVEFKTGDGTVSDELYETLTGIQTGNIQDKLGWTVDIE